MLRAHDLSLVTTFPAGRSPGYLAVDAGSRMLLALADDGSQVTGIQLRGLRALPARDVHAGAEAELDGPARGRPVDYFVAEPAGIAHYKGSPGEVERKHRVPVAARASAGDETKVSRLYVGEAGTDRLLAVQVTSGEDGLAVAAATRLGEPVEHLATDSTRVYAVTEHKLVMLATSSFANYEDHTFRVVDAIDLRTVLDAPALRGATPSGIAVGEDRVYLSMAGRPYLLGIDKPEL